MKSAPSFGLNISQLDEQTSMKELDVGSAMPTLDDNYPSIILFQRIF